LQRSGKGTDFHWIGQEVLAVRTTAPHWHSLGWGLAAVVVLGSGALAGLFVPRFFRPAPDPEKPPPGTPVYTREAFTHLVMGKTRSEVIQVLGQPERTSTDSDAEYWHYHSRTKDPVSGKVDSDVQLVLHAGRVESVNY
jgi:outer membrane protein assembly factor BamE (lipoprotein component of BamABCDE complex)